MWADQVELISLFILTILFLLTVFKKFHLGSFYHSVDPDDVFFFVFFCDESLKTQPRFYLIFPVVVMETNLSLNFKMSERDAAYY